MPMEPHADETQSEFMARCVPDMIGDGPNARPSEQAVAICLNIWRESDNLKGRTVRTKQETQAEFMDRCTGNMTDSGMEDDQATAVCLRIWRDDNTEPQTDETQSQFMDRCVPAAMDDGAPQDQAIAVCLATWRDADNTASYKNGKGMKTKAPTPNDGESNGDFIDRCTTALMDDGADESEAASACALAWENRSNRAAKPVRTKTHAEVVHGMEFVLSDETPDRMGDIISASGWVLDNFAKNPIALFNHNSDFPIGKWSTLRSEKGALRGHLELAPEGTSDRIDEIRRLIAADILRAVSVGFKPLNSKPRMEGDKFIGEHFLKQELVETSLVSVPANPNALAIAKSLDISEETLNLVFAEHGARGRVERRGGSVGKLAVTAKPKERALQTTALTKRIETTQQDINALRDKITDHLASIDDSNITDVQFEVTDELNRELAQKQRTLAMLMETERNMAGAAVASEESRALVQRGGSSSVSRPYTIASVSKSPPVPTSKEGRLELVVKAGVIQVFAHTRKLPLEAARLAIVNAGYPRYGDEATRVFSEYLARSEVAPAMTTVPGWAAELAQTTYADYLELLYAKSVFRSLISHGLSLTFGRAGQIRIPTRERLPSIAGSFVGEGMPIPVRQAGFRSEVLTPKKMAVITTWTREMDEASIPAIEGILRNAIQEDTASVLDSCLMDNAPADAIRPAGLLYNVTPIPGSNTGNRFEQLVADFQALIGSMLTATLGNVRDLVFLMNPQQTLAGKLTALPGVSAFPFMADLSAGRMLGYTVIESGSVAVGGMIALDAADFVTVGGAAPRFDISDQATLHMEDTDPMRIGPRDDGDGNGNGGGGGGASPSTLRSLWQTDSIGLRLILPVNWTMRRRGMVAAITGIRW